MPKMPDGSVVSSYFQTGAPMSGKDIYNQGMVFMIGQVEKVHYTDDASNISKEFVEYDVSVRDEKGGQSIFRNMRYIALFGGTNDFEEQILEPNEYAVQGKLDTTNIFKNKNGSIVLVASINGSKDKPFIAACIQHPRRKGAKRSDGIRKIGEFRGFQWEINKLGEFRLTYLGNRTPDGKLVRASTGPTQIKIDQNGVFSLTDNLGQSLTMDRVNKKIRVVTAENYEIAVGKDQIVTIAGNSSETISGSETTTTTGDYNHTAANMNFTSSGDIKIGSSGADQNLVLGPKFMQLYNAHTHVGNLGVPTGVPMTPMTAAQLASRNFTE